MKRWLSMGALLMASLAIAQEHPASPPEQDLRGTWMATAGSNAFHGRWWASLVANTHNSAHGSWTLLSDANQIVLEGTWSAKKSSSGWQGTWSARVGGGPPMSGTWTSDINDVSVKTFEEMLRQAIGKQVSGSWQKGRMQGNWWLQGPG